MGSDGDITPTQTLPPQGGGFSGHSLSDRLVAAFLLGLALFLPPLLAVFSATATLAGVPLLYLYLFAAWIALTAVLALIVERAPPDEPPPEPPGG